MGESGGVGYVLLIVYFELWQVWSTVDVTHWIIIIIELFMSCTFVKPSFMWSCQHKDIIV